MAANNARGGGGGGNGPMNEHVEFTVKVSDHRERRKRKITFGLFWYHVDLCRIHTTELTF